MKFMVHCLSGVVCGFLRGQATPCSHALCCFYITRLLKSEIVLRHLLQIYVLGLQHYTTLFVFWNATPRCHKTKILYFSKIISKSSILNFVSKLIFYFHACDQNCAHFSSFSSTTLCEFWLAQLFLSIVSFPASFVSNWSPPSSSNHSSHRLPILLLALPSVLLLTVCICIWS